MLAQHDNENVRGNAIFGLAHIARTKGHLDKRLVKPVILNELRTNSECKSMILDAITDINQFLGWKLASKHLI